MGDGDKKGGSPAPLILAALVVAVSIVAKQFELESRRPSQSERPAHYSQPLQTVPARLWQDPIAAIAELRGKAGPPGTFIWRSPQQIVERYLEDYEEQINDVQHVNVLVMPVFGGPYAEYGEGRRRQRYAVATGLLESDFAPVDAEKLGVLRHHFPGTKLVLDVPFEWYACKEREPKKCEDGDHVLVMWVNDDLLGTHPLTRLESLYPDAAEMNLTKSVIGPAGSGTLIAMLAEAHQRKGSPPFAGMRIWSPNATIQPQSLLRAARIPAEQLGRGGHDPAGAGELPASWWGVQEIFAGAGVSFVSTIGTDQQTAAMLAREATLRQYSVRCLWPQFAWPPACLESNKVLIVSEGDTEYARSLAMSFSEGLVQAQCRGADDSGECGSKVMSRVFRLTYLRGLDGEKAPKLVGDRPDKDESKPSDKPDSRAADYSAIELLRAGETATGNVQYDYLRRLGRSAKALERAAGVEAMALFQAIAIFGSDPYDKLLVMQALRSEFPGAYFMTTDLDARYLQREQLEWSRNLIVASSYGLELNRGLREHAAPFRDAYQSSLFVATRLAVAPGCDPSVQEFIEARLARPRLFEISTAGAIELKYPERPVDPSALRYVVQQGRAARLSTPPESMRFASVHACEPFIAADGSALESLHPSAVRKWPWYGYAISVALVTILLLASWYSLTVRRKLRALWRYLAKRWPELVLAFGLVLLVCLPYDAMWQATFLFFAASALLAAIVADTALSRPLLAIRARAGWAVPVRLLSVMALAGLAAAFAAGAWTGAAAWPAVLLALPLAAAAGVLAYPAAARRFERRKSWALLATAVAGLLLAALFAAAFSAEGEEPTGLLNGASSWLSEALRVAALAFNLWAVGHVLARLRANAKEIHQAFFPGRKFPVPPPRGVLAILRNPHEKMVEEWRGTDFLKQGNPDAVKLWGTYLALCEPPRLICRSLIGALLFFAIFTALMVANPVMPPLRGVWSSLFDTFLLMLSVFTFFWLIFLVVDVVRLTAKFVQYQSIGQTEWPDKVLPEVKIADMDAVLRDTTDLELLSRRTQAVSKLVTLPFWPLLLLVLARHEIVDAWAWTWPMVLLFVLCFAFLIVMAVQLRGAAEKGKTDVLERLVKRRLKALGNKDGGAADYLESVIKAMERTTTGAYSPIWQAEWLRGLAIPTTGLGAFEILRSLGVF
jgi:hypothetical protein